MTDFINRWHYWMRQGQDLHNAYLWTEQEHIEQTGKRRYKDFNSFLSCRSVTYHKLKRKPINITKIKTGLIPKDL